MLPIHRSVRLVSHHVPERDQRDRKVGSAERITEFDKAIRTGTGDVGENDVASIQFLKDFLGIP